MAVRQVKIADLRHTFDVRRQLNQEHVMHLALVLESGKELPAIAVTPRMEVLDGRHRVEAYTLNDRDTIPATVLEVRDDLAAKLTTAMNANLGGSMPPSREDIIFAIGQLIEAKASRSQVCASVNLPKEVTLKYYNLATERRHARKLAEGRALVADGMPTQKAAERVGLPYEELRSAIKEGKKKDKPAFSYGRQLAIVRSVYTSHSHRIEAQFRKVGDATEVGDLSRSEADALAEEALRRARLHVRNMENLQQRLSNSLTAIQKAGA